MKLENILIDVKGNIKLVDFGFSILSGKHERIIHGCGTPHYMDPDLAGKKPYIA